MMNDKIFGEVSFDAGWNKDENISLWGKTNGILVTAVAYYESEAITEAQQSSYRSYNLNKSIMEKKIEQLLSNYMDEPEKHLTPRFLVFEKDGAYALMLDDDNDPDNGVAVQLAPVAKVTSQDAYL